MYKTCRRCGKKKPTSSYYIHKQMFDGHLNICKACTKERVALHSRTADGIAVEKRRNATDKRKKWLSQYLRKRRNLNPGKNRARGTVANFLRQGRLVKKPCEKCGDPKVHAHHPDYRKRTQVIWLCGLHHRQIHPQYKRKY